MKDTDRELPEITLKVSGKECPKCLSDKIVVAFTPKNSLINHSGRIEIETEFVASSQYDFFWQHKEARDHLKKHCRTCQYVWREAVSDDVNHYKQRVNQ